MLALPSGRIAPENLPGAAEASLNRGWGRPAQMIAGDADDEPRGARENRQVQYGITGAHVSLVGNKS
jgi:hypothetical protein